MMDPWFQSREQEPEAGGYSTLLQLEVNPEEAFDLRQSRLMNGRKPQGRHAVDLINIGVIFPKC